MKIKLLVAAGGVDFNFRGGQEVTVGQEIKEEMANEFLTAGIATEVKESTEEPAVEAGKKAAKGKDGDS